jgi:hypothetical protein
MTRRVDDPGMRPVRLALAALLLCSSLALAAPGVGHVTDGAAAALSLVAPRVEQACGGAFTTRPAVRVVEESEALRIAGEDLRPELEKRYPGVSDGQMRFLMQMNATSAVRSTLARYTLSRKEILLVRKSFDAQRKALGIPEKHAWHLLVATLAHECVHALDDRRFDIAALYRGAPDEEALRARVMVVEGRALHFGRKVANEVGVPAEIRDLLPGGTEPNDFRVWGIRLTSQYGLRFVDRLVQRGGVALADRAVKEPPGTTHQVCQPARWPDGEGSPAPMRTLEKLGLSEKAHVLSELQLRTRYAAADGLPAAEALFAGFRGGAQAIVEETNVAVLSFSGVEGAKRYAERSRREAAVRLVKNTLVLRVAGPKAKRDDVLARLAAALR